MKFNACITLLSSRTKCLKKCLESIHKFYNHRYNYPVHVYYFDDIYDSPAYRKMIHDSISPNIHFTQIPYKTPAHIKEQELYYNRKELWYVNKSFSIKRKGYLHMSHYRSNMYGYPNTLLHNYDYVIVYDDESGHVKELPYNPIEVMAGRPEDMGALFYGQKLKDGKPHQGHKDTRIGLWNFMENFFKENGIVPKSQLLKDLLKDKDAELHLHYLPWANTYVIKTKMFKTELWKKWIAAVNENGGLYKFRWTDLEIISLFYLIYDDKPIYNFKAIEEGYLDWGLFRNLQNIAPSVKHPEL